MRGAIVTGLVVLLAACGAQPDAGDSEASQGPAEVAAAVMLGGCVLTAPVGEAPADLLTRTALLPTTEYGRFDKTVTVAGLTLVGDDAISDAFMELVARTIEEIFRPSARTDVEAQARVLRAQYEYRAVIPFFYGRPDEADEAAFEVIAADNSACDIIMEGVDGQVMEVVEHILHYVTDIGLHYAFPAEWGIDPGSEIARAMTLAADAGYYDIAAYDDIDEEDIRFRVAVQEFAYWVISTAWDLQTDYGPRGENEWTLTTPDALRANLPELWAMVERTAGRVLTAPRPATLRAIGPTRDEEADRGR